MAKALYGFVGEPRAAMLLRQVESLQRRVFDLEEALAAAQAQLTTLTEMDDADLKIELEEGALA